MAVEYDGDGDPFRCGGNVAAVGLRVAIWHGDSLDWLPRVGTPNEPCDHALSLASHVQCEQLVDRDQISINFPLHSHVLGAADKASDEPRIQSVV